MKILAISGSLRAASHNTALLRAAAELAPEGIEVELYEGLDRLPAFNEDLESGPVPYEVQRLLDEIDSADAVLFSTPEYNGTMPGHLKTAVDWASRPHGESALWGKPVAAVGASVTAYGAMWAQDHLRRALGLAGARVLDTELAVATAHERFDDTGQLHDDETRDALAELVSNLVHHHHEYAQVA
jgi:chromate reductase, NAD(P)H dehydrogenase (quinone)